MKQNKLALCLLLAAWNGAEAQHTARLSRWGMKAGEYSGITSLGEERYAVVNDGSPMGFSVWHIETDSLKGRILHVTEESSHLLAGSEVRDQEDIAYDIHHGWLWICGEDQRVVAHAPEGTSIVGELSIPEAYGRDSIRANRGFEALCYDPYARRLITVTESPLLHAVQDSVLELLFFSPQGFLQEKMPYKLGSARPHKTGRGHYHGVVAMTMLDASTLLVLEREASIARHYVGSRCRHTLAAFDLHSKDRKVLKEWSTRFGVADTRMANYEGMCTGPRLADGRSTLLLVSDSEHRQGRGPWHLKDYLMLLPLPDGHAEEEE